MTDDVLSTCNRWLAAEEAGDTATLEALLTDDFRGIGAMGFVLDKRQWIERFHHPDRRLTYSAVSWHDVEVVIHGDTAIAVGREEQRGTVGDRPIDGTFRMTQILVRTDLGWRVAGAQLSPMAAP
jgi:ketosteroid isomerase-like protein